MFIIHKKRNLFKVSPQHIQSKKDYLKNYLSLLHFSVKDNRNIYLIQNLFFNWIRHWNFASFGKEF